MNIIRKIFERLTNNGLKRYCICGHSVSANLPFCPHCGCRLNSSNEYPLD